MDHQIRKILWFALTGIILAAACDTQSWRDFLLNVITFCFHLSILLILFKENRNQENINTWNWKTIALTLLIIIEIVLAIVHFENILQLVHVLISWLLAFVGLKFLQELLDMDRRLREPIGEPVELALDNFNGLDYGCGMAYSYFFGYLHLMLPSPGDERVGIRELINNFANTHGVQFGAIKLFILIPSSTHCPPSVADRSRLIEEAENLSWRRINRAGVTGRPYQHPVYKLWVNRQEPPIYVCVEYATPLLTLYEIMNQNTEESRLYRRYRDRLVTNFYTTLQMVINNDRDCRDLIELIYYRDVDQDGNPLNLDQLDVGNLILERINLAEEE